MLGSFAFLALLAGAQAAPGLKVTLSLPGAAQRAAAGRLPIVEASVANSGDDDLFIFPYNTLLQQGSPTPDFIIDGSEADGEATEPSFHGIRVNPVRDVQKLLKAGTLVHLKPGQSKSVKATLTKRYSFENHLSVLNAEVNTVSFEYRPGMTPNRKRSTSEASAWWAPSGIAGDFISDEDAATDAGATKLKGSAAEDCDTDYIEGVVALSTQGLKASLSAISSGSQDFRDAYETWFGTYSSSGVSKLQSHLSHIYNSLPSFQFNCPGECDSGTLAYVYPDEPYHVNLCDYWFTWPKCNAQGSTELSEQSVIVHEGSHFIVNGGTQDITYGASNCEDLAQQGPDSALMNADNHGFFEEAMWGC